MNKLAKSALVGLTAIGLGTAAFSVSAGMPDCGHMGPMSFRGDKAKFAEFMEKRHAAMHTALKLSAEQEGAWKEFTTRMKSVGMQNRPEREKMAELPAPERMDKMLAMMKEGEKRMETRAAAVKEFYAVLTPEQQKVFDAQMTPRGRHSRPR